MTGRHATSSHEAKCHLPPRRGEGRPAPSGPSPRPHAPRGPPSVSPRCPSTTPARPALTAQLGPGLLASRLDVCDGLRPVSFRPGSPSLNAIPYAAARAVRSPHWPPPFWPATLGRGGGVCGSGPRAQRWPLRSPPHPLPTRYRDCPAMPDVPFAPPPATGQRAPAASPGPPGPQRSGADIRHLSCSSRRAPDEEVRICCGAPRAGSRGRALGDSLVSTKRSPSFSKNGACRELLRMSPTRWPDAQVRSAEGGLSRHRGGRPAAPQPRRQLLKNFQADRTVLPGRVLAAPATGSS